MIPIHVQCRLTVHMNDEDYAILQSSLSPVVNPDSEQVTPPTH